MDMQTKRWNIWPWAITGWLVLVAAINSVVLYLALSSRPTPMATGSPYAEGLAFESEVASQKAFAQAGLKPIFKGFTPSHPKGTRIEIQLEGWTRWPNAPHLEKIVLKGLRADGTRADFRAELRPVRGKAGYFEALTPNPMDRGSWFLALTLELRQGSGTSELLWKGVRSL